MIIQNINKLNKRLDHLLLKTHSTALNNPKCKYLYGSVMFYNVFILLKPPFPFPQGERLCAPSPVGEGWDGGLNTLYNNLYMWLIYMSNVTYFINAQSL